MRKHKQSLMLRSRAEKVRRRLKAVNRGRPRLSVFVSGKHVYAQIIDDVRGRTAAHASDKETGVLGKTEKAARAVGELLGRRAKDSKVGKVYFDRGGKKYHGRVRALADAAREGGLKF